MTTVEFVDIEFFQGLRSVVKIKVLPSVTARELGNSHN